MIETDEEIIIRLEEIDANFSSINRTLKKIREVVKKIGKQNDNLVTNLSPWCRFFESDKNRMNNNLSETEILMPVKNTPINISFHTNIDSTDSPVVMKFSSPKDPFLDPGSSEIISKNLMVDLDARFKSTNSSNITSSTMIAPQINFESDDISEASEVIPFDLELIPPIFRNEQDLPKIYEYIVASKGATIENVYSAFSNISNEKINIFIDLLMRKNFIFKKNGVYNA